MFFNNADIIKAISRADDRLIQDKDTLLKLSFNIAEAMHFGKFKVNPVEKIFPRKVFPHEVANIELTQQILLGYANEDLLEDEIISMVKRLSPDIQKIYEISRVSAGLSGHTLGLFIDYSKALPVFMKRQKTIWDESVKEVQESSSTSIVELTRLNEEFNERLENDLSRAYEDYNQWFKDAGNALEDAGKIVDDFISSFLK